MYDLLIINGRVMDPSQNIDAILDIAIIGDKIALLAKGIASDESKQVIDVKGKIVTPGLIDIHCHVYDGFYEIAAPPDLAGVQQGVTTVVDGGSSGHATFIGFPRYVIPANLTTVLCFIHLGSIGQQFSCLGGGAELRYWDEVDLEATATTIHSNPEVIKGVKLRLAGKLASKNGIKLTKLAKKVAQKFSLPLMLHIGDDLNPRWPVPPELTQKALPLLQSGDILTHIYTGKSGNLLQEDGRVLPELREAVNRGVILDVARGMTNISYDVAVNEISQGILPSTISTDICLTSLNRFIFGLTVTMSEFLALGFDLSQVIEMTTINPARALKIEGRKGSLKPGMDADISILELISGKWRQEDFQQHPLEMQNMLEPRLTVKLGKVIIPNPVARPKSINI